MEKFRFYFLFIALICIGAFILQMLIPGFTERLLLNSNVFRGEYWRFLTSIFIHANITHLVFNLFAFVIFGILLEKLIGSSRFLIIFLGSGVLANIVSVNFYSSSLGASGAIYGIIGCLAILRPMMIVWAFGVIMPMFIAAIIWIIGDVLGVFGLGGTNVGYIAHISGIVLGIIFGLFLRDWKKIRKTNYKVNIPEDIMRSWEGQYMR